MQDKPFVDYYEVFQASPNASLDTIERLFRYMAKHLHPDVAESGDVQKFSRLVEAYETLHDPVQRAAYDAQYDRQKKQHTKLIEDTACLDDDSAQRHKMMSLLYARRRQDMKSPGIGDTTLEQLVGAPPEVIAFHLWFFKEKGWVRREENGLLAITAEGVDQIEATLERKAATIEKRITSEHERIELRPFHSTPHSR
jgi:curved DNA-binding protein CbpA